MFSPGRRGMGFPDIPILDRHAGCTGDHGCHKGRMVRDPKLGKWHWLPRKRACQIKCTWDIFTGPYPAPRKWSRVLTRFGAMARWPWTFRQQNNRKGHPCISTCFSAIKIPPVSLQACTRECNVHTLPPLSEIVITGRYARGNSSAWGTLWQICKKLNIITRLASSPWRDWSSKTSPNRWFIPMK